MAPFETKCLGLALLLFLAPGCAERGGGLAVAPSVTLAAGAEQVEFSAADGAREYADYYPAGSARSSGVILMFHQAGSNAGEYATIAPQIIKLGVDCLAVDQRSGGNMFGRENRTKATAKGNVDYMAGYNDLLGAVRWAKSNGYKQIIPWGSSYSASLTLKLLGQGSFPCGLVFSPGEYFDQKDIVESWAAQVKVPVFFACTPGELKQGRQQLFNALGGKSNVLASFDGGVHGSSTLIASKSQSASQYMRAVESFLRKNLDLHK